MTFDGGRGVLDMTANDRIIALESRVARLEGFLFGVRVILEDSIYYHGDGIDLHLRRRLDRVIAMIREIERECGPHE